MKRIVSLLLALAITVGIVAYVPVEAQAAEITNGNCGENATWALEDGTLTISGTGDMADYTNSVNAPWYPIRDQILSVVVEDGVTSIGNSAFYYCSNITSVTISGTVTTIGEWAFSFCDSLVNVEIPEGLESIGYMAFRGCCSLPSLLLPGSLSSIAEHAFDSCIGLTEITFCGDSPIMGEDALFYVEAIAYYPDGNDTWTEEVMQNYGGTLTWVAYEPQSIIASGTCGENLTWTLDEHGVLTISGYGKMKAFAGVVVTPWYQWRKEIKNIVIKDGVTNIASYAFEGCVNLESIIIPEGVISIGAFAFSSCHELASLSLPQTVTSIGIRAFSDCDTLHSVTIPKNVASIGKFAFLDCDKLRSIWVDTENPNFCNDDNGILFNKNMTTLIAAPQSIAGEYAVPDTVVRIEEYAFYFCKNLTNLIIPKSVSEFTSTSCIGCGQLIGIWVDSENRSLCNDDRGVLFDKHKTTLIKAPDTIAREYSIPVTVKDIDEHAFFSCDLLTSVSIPLGVTEIPDRVFYSCRKLSSVALANTITFIDDDAFYWCSSLKSITIPASVTEIGTYAFSSSGLSEITFLGNAPKISDTAFNNKTITAYYLADNKTWTEEVMQNYGGTITWVPYCAKGHDFADGYCTNCGAVQSDIFITQQPTNAEAALGENYCVTVEVEGEGLKYQWYFRNAGSKIWYKSSVRDNTYDDVMTTARAGREVYCVITDANGNKVTTDIVKLIRIAKEELQIVTQPVSDEAVLGEAYSVTVVAKGEGLKYQWYFRNKGSLIWYKSSVKTDTYTNVMTKARAGREIYCVITDALGNTITTDIVKLIRVPKEELQIVTQPTNVQAALGDNYCVTVEAKGEELKYQWYFCNAGSDTWYKSSVRDNTYDDMMTTTRAGREIYCVITDAFGNTVTTNIVRLIRIPKEELKLTMPVTDTYAAMGQKYCVTVNAQGEGLKYTWYFRNAGSKTWYRSGVTDNTYDDVMTKARANREVYCVITDALGNKVYTNVVKLVCVENVTQIQAEEMIAAADILLAQIKADPELYDTYKEKYSRLMTYRDETYVHVYTIFIQPNKDEAEPQEYLDRSYAIAMQYYMELRMLVGVTQEQAEALIAACDGLLEKIDADPAIYAIWEDEHDKLQVLRDEFDVERTYYFIKPEWNDGSNTQNTVNMAYLKAWQYYAVLKELTGL